MKWISIMFVGILPFIASCFLSNSASAKPAFIGNCLSPDDVKGLYAKYSDIQQTNGQNSEEIRGRWVQKLTDINITSDDDPLPHVNGDAIFKGVFVGASREILVLPPPNYTIVATICGIREEQSPSPDYGPHPGNAPFYNGQPVDPGLWCFGPGLHSDGEGRCKGKYSDVWFNNFDMDRNTIRFHNDIPKPPDEL